MHYGDIGDLITDEQLRIVTASYFPAKNAWCRLRTYSKVILIFYRIDQQIFVSKALAKLHLLQDEVVAFNFEAADDAEAF